MVDECPHCAAGNKPYIRHATQELVHDFVQQLGPTSRKFSQTICWNDPKWKEMKEKKNAS